MAVMLGSEHRDSMVVCVEVTEYLEAKAVAAEAVRE